MTDHLTGHRSIKRQVEVKIAPTIKELAAMIVHMNNEDQAQLISAMAEEATFSAAAELAAVAMEEAMRQRAVALPRPGNKPYTGKQRRLIEQFRQDMAATGALVPAYWTHASAREIAQAGIDAVREAAGHG